MKFNLSVDEFDIFGAWLKAINCISTILSLYNNSMKKYQADC